MKRAMIGLVIAMGLGLAAATAEAHNPWDCGHGRDYPQFGWSGYRGGWNYPAPYVARRPVFVQPGFGNPYCGQPTTVYRPRSGYFNPYDNGMFYNSPNSFFGIRF